MKTIQLSQEELQKMIELYDAYHEIYGDEDAVWDIDELEEMRKIGQEFMDIFAAHLKTFKS